MFVPMAFTVVAAALGPAAALTLVPALARSYEREEPLPWFRAREIYARLLAALSPSVRHHGTAVVLFVGSMFAVTPVTRVHAASRRRQRAGATPLPSTAMEQGVEYSSRWSARSRPAEVRSAVLAGRPDLATEAMGP
jgi:Cu/Ag efflux pump CusA